MCPDFDTRVIILTHTAHINNLKPFFFSLQKHTHVISTNILIIISKSQGIYKKTNFQDCYTLTH